MKERKSNLDERQEQMLLQIEHKGCWLAFWGLLAAMVVQILIYGFEWKAVAGEWVVFMVLCTYIGFACEKNGIWDRRLKPDARTNFLVALIAGLVFGALMFFVVFRNYPDKIGGSIAAGVFAAAGVFFSCFLALQISARSFRKRVEKLEREEEAREAAEES